MKRIKKFLKPCKSFSNMTTAEKVKKAQKSRQPRKHLKKIIAMQNAAIKVHHKISNVLNEIFERSANGIQL